MGAAVEMKGKLGIMKKTEKTERTEGTKIKIGDMAGFMDRWRMQCWGRVIGIDREKGEIEIEYWKRNGKMGRTSKRFEELNFEIADDMPF